MLFIALASFSVRGHSYPGSICRIPEAIYCIILMLAFICFQATGPIYLKKHSEAKAVAKPSVYNYSTLMGFGPVFKLPRLLVVYY